VLDLIEATPEFFEYPMCDREPLTAWGAGRVTLLGDAAHPMYPVGSNGPAQSIIDGKRLGHFLELHEPTEAIRAYEQERIPITSGLVRSSRLAGPSASLTLCRNARRTGLTNLRT
jgi:2-polyprenyl-6-methoxyphenol hydroxylase-like FAD-dependent oxidoreductase